ncbi:MAG: PPOX class F420-dependent oxidoreductase [Anaerolineales bacterium]|nr:PPOX class F420-dependent oxidoreductase [Anaerolineales bacterium]
MTFPEKFADLFAPETKSFLCLATVNDKGTPQLSPVWFDVEGDYILVNTAEGRVKARNMQANDKVALVIQDPKNPYRYVGMQGKVVSVTNEGADDHINMLSMRYNGAPWQFGEGQKRLIFKIQPTSFAGNG